MLPAGPALCGTHGSFGRETKKNTFGDMVNDGIVSEKLHMVLISQTEESFVFLRRRSLDPNPVPKIKI